MAPYLTKCYLWIAYAIKRRSDGNGAYFPPPISCGSMIQRASHRRSEDGGFGSRDPPGISFGVKPRRLSICIVTNIALSASVINWYGASHQYSDREKFVAVWFWHQGPRNSQIPERSPTPKIPPATQATASLIKTLQCHKTPFRSHGTGSKIVSRRSLPWSNSN